MCVCFLFEGLYLKLKTVTSCYVLCMWIGQMLTVTYTTVLQVKIKEGYRESNVTAVF